MVFNAICSDALPVHGGNLQWAEQAFGIPKIKWLDLSTGISPWSWPVPTLPTHVWRDLPPSSEQLTRAASQVYGWSADHIVPTPGSQWAIATLPRLVPHGAVALPSIGYQEHRIAWQNSGHVIRTYDRFDQLVSLVESGEIQYAVIINPNNPSTDHISPANIASLAQTLAQRTAASESLVVVDEAFADYFPHLQIRPNQNENVVVLRSLGKFFGLAGVRLGFALADTTWCTRLHAELPTWGIHHPALYIGEHALSDRDWLVMQRQRIREQEIQMRNELSKYYGETCVRSGGLFCSVFGEHEPLLQDFMHFAKQAMLTRFISGNNGRAILRFGLPGNHWDRFHSHLYSAQHACIPT